MAPLFTTQSPQRNTTVAKVVILVLCALMGASAFGLTIYRGRLQRKVSATYYLATPLRPGAASASTLKQKPGAKKDDAKSTATQLSEEVADLLQSHPLFGAIPKAGPPQANLQGILGDTALINGKWIKVGESADGIKLVQTMIGKVLVEIEGKQQEVSVFSDLPSKPFPAGPPSLMASGSSDGMSRGPRGRFGRMRDSMRSSSSFSYSGSGGGSAMSSRDRAIAKKLEKTYGERLSQLPESDRRKLIGNYGSIGEAYAAYKRGEFKPPIPQDQLDKFVSTLGADDEGEVKGKKKGKKNRNMDDFGGNAGMASGSFSAPGAGPSGRKFDPETLARLRAQREAGGAPMPPSGMNGPRPVTKSGGLSDAEREARRAARESGASGMGSASRSAFGPGSSGRPDRPPSALGSRSRESGGAPVKVPPVKAPSVKVPSVKSPPVKASASASSSRAGGPPPSALRERKAQAAAGGLNSSLSQKKPSVSGKSSGSSANGEDRPKSRKARNPYRN